MNHYRIGRIDEPWTNFTPPIRGGIFRGTTVDVDTGTDTESDSDTEFSSCPPSFNSSRTSLNLIDDEGDGESHSSKSLLPLEVPTSSSLLKPLDRIIKHRNVAPKAHAVAVGVSESTTYTTREEYTSSVMQKEIDDDIGNNPSLDEETQRDIALKYSKLHDRVKNEGYYQCNYSDYGKEMLRYSLLFALFIVCLRAEWYMTSAAFLGLFWVNTSSSLA